jgi:hypothetical protein
MQHCHGGTFFSPRPYIREAASEAVWGASALQVSKPAPIAHLIFETSVEEGKGDAALTWHATRLTARVSRYSPSARSIAAPLTPSQGDGLARSVAPLAVPVSKEPMANLKAWAELAGVPEPRMRSDQAWIGGGNPQQAALLLPDTSAIRGQLDDYYEFLFNHQRSRSKQAAEAIAYQLLTIHPLADGNGRLSRLLLIKLAAATESPFPLYLVWCLKFAAQRLLSGWQEAALRGRAAPDDGHYQRWLLALSELRHVDEEAASAGVDRRVLGALLLYGAATEQSILCANPACNPSLARKLMQSAAAGPCPPTDQLKEKLETLMFALKRAVES